jgi:hypothetical protein
MNIKDIEHFRLGDAVKFHPTLNKRLFTDDRLQEDVRDQLMMIAEDFVEFMGIDTLEVADVRLYGSNAAYTYTKHSDIDLHILVDMSGITDDEVYLELFNSKKRLYNDSLDITVRGMPVELYMQDKDDVVKSLGDYSVLNDRWIKFPTKSKASIEEHSVREKFKRLVALSELALRSDDIDTLDDLLDILRRYRKAGLEAAGEFSPENLAFKALRSRGIVDKLYKHRDRLHSDELSIDEDVVESIGQDEESHLFEEYKQFLRTKEFDFSDAPIYNSYSSNDDVRRNYDQKILKFVWESRGEIAASSVFRDLNKKWQIKKIIKESTDIDDIHALLDRCFGELDQSLLKPGKIVDVVEVSIPTNGVVQPSIHENIKIKQVQLDRDGKVMIMDSKGKIFIQGHFGHQDVEYRIVDKGMGDKGLILLYLNTDSVDGSVDYKGWRIAAPNETFTDRMNRQFRESKGDLSESSGYIPSESERNDPRFKTALTVDVKPDTMKKGAMAMGLGSIKRDGRPQQLKASGKFTR